MQHPNQLINKIRTVIGQMEPNAKILLYGSYARGTQSQKSDIDILVLLDKSEISREDEIRIKYPLYELEFEYGVIISPLVLSSSEWLENHKVTPFYKNVINEAIEL